MRADVQLSSDFWLHEAPCWWQANDHQVAQLEETAARVLQPVRDAYGLTEISSWLWWRDGCTARSGAHAGGGTVDFVVPGANMRDVWQWGRLYLVPSGYIGRWIYEPALTAEENNGQPQGEHIHMATRADMIAYNGDSRIQVLEQLPSGEYVLYEEWGGPDNPIEIPGLEVTVGARLGWVGALLTLALVGALAPRRHPATT